MLAEIEASVRNWTEEQLRAIERREGDLMLAASAGSGKTSVLVERFVRAVLEDGVEVFAILTITFTEKAAAELRDRIRARLRELDADEAARATEGAFISTIHGFCARVLRANALAAGIDPLFVVLDDAEATRLAGSAFDAALEELALRTPGGVELIASYGAGPLRGAIRDVYGELRSRGQREPLLAPLGPAPSLDEARAALEQAAAAAAAELGGLANPGVKVLQALERLERCAELIAQDEWWPGELDRIALPGGNGSALSTPVCLEYSRALAEARRACEHSHVERTHGLLGKLLLGFGRRYEQLKRSVSGLDFEDLELMTRDLLAEHDELRERYAGRFERIMVDELQDTNGVQLALIESIARGNLFTVGDAQQSIYAFRHAEVELFERLGERLAAHGARATLQTNFRSRSEIIEVLNAAFAHELGEQFMPLVAGRTDPPADEPLVELLIADKAADWEIEGLAAPWRRAEARALAERVRELIDGGAAPREIVVLTRATTDLRAYERALEDCGIPTYLIGGRGYWSHPQIVDMVAYLRALANPRDEEALYTLLASPLVGLSLGGLVLVAAAARAATRDPWWVVREDLDPTRPPPGVTLDELEAADRERLARFGEWFADERAARLRLGIEQLIERALVLTGYDLEMLALPGGQRRLANVRKLMRLGREFEAVHGADLSGFLELVRGRAGGWAGDPRESEAPVEGEALDAVRLMTIHRAKGLEFEIVCVADLGRAPWRRAELMRIGRDGRFGMRLSEPGTARAVPALDYKELGDEQQAAEQREERRVFYVAMTRARERLILSGAARLEEWKETASPMAWIGPAVVPEISALAADASDGVVDGVAWRIVRPGDVAEEASGAPPDSSPPHAAPLAPPPSAVEPPAAPHVAPGVSTLSYSSLGEYQRCGYRFYAERVLRLPEVPERPSGNAGPAVDLSGAERGIVLHSLLESLDFRRPARPAPTTVIAIARRAGVLGEVDVEELAELVEAFARSQICVRLGRAVDVRREERFSFLLSSGLRITGALDVLARESDPARPSPTADRSLIVDYKSDRIADTPPEEVVAGEYAVQRLIYAIAALRAGARAVEVVHLFLEQPERPVSASFTVADLPALEERLERLANGVLRREFRVTEAPHRAVCHGCPAEGGLCSWPLELTRRQTPDRLF